MCIKIHLMYTSWLDTLNVSTHCRRLSRYTEYPQRNWWEHRCRHRKKHIIKINIVQQREYLLKPKSKDIITHLPHNNFRTIKSKLTRTTPRGRDVTTIADRSWIGRWGLGESFRRRVGSRINNSCWRCDLRDRTYWRARIPRTHAIKRKLRWLIVLRGQTTIIIVN